MTVVAAAPRKPSGGLAALAPLMGVFLLSLMAVGAILFYVR